MTTEITGFGRDIKKTGALIDVLEKANGPVMNNGAHIVAVGLDFETGAGLNVLAITKNGAVVGRYLFYTEEYGFSWAYGVYFDGVDAKKDAKKRYMELVLGNVWIDTLGFY